MCTTRQQIFVIACVFDTVKFDNMLQKYFNSGYRGSTSSPTGIIELLGINGNYRELPSTHRSLTCSDSIIETLEHDVKSVQS